MTVSSSIVLAVGLLVGVAVPWLFWRVDVSDCGADEELCAHGDSTGLVVAGAVLGAAGVCGLVVAAGLRRRRPWARVGVRVTLGVYAVVALVALWRAATGPGETPWAVALPPTLALVLVGLALGAALTDH